MTVVDEILLNELDRANFKGYMISFAMNTFNTEDKKLALIEFLRYNSNVLLMESDLYKFAFELNNKEKTKLKKYHNK